MEGRGEGWGGEDLGILDVGQTIPLEISEVYTSSWMRKFLFSIYCLLLFSYCFEGSKFNE